MKAKVTTAYCPHGNNMGYMIAIQTNGEGTPYNKYLLEDNQAYFTESLPEARSKAKNLNNQFGDFKWIKEKF